MTSTTPTDDQPDPDLVGSLRMEHVAADLDVTPAVVREMARAGTLPAFKVGKSWRIGRREYVAWKAERTRLAARRARYTAGL